MPKADGSNRPRFRVLPTVLLTVAILALPTVVYALGRSSSSFGIERIAVSGTSLVPQKRVIRLLRREFQGRNLFTVTSGDVRATLSSLCYVAGVAVDRDFPDTLRVAVVEYVPVAYALAGNRWYVLARDGRVICEVEQNQPSRDAAAPASSASPSPSASAAAAPAGPSGQVAKLVKGPIGAALELPRLTVAGSVRAGGIVSDPTLPEKLRVVAALPGLLRSRLDVVQSDAGRIKLRFTGGPVAVWGDSERTLAKAIALRAVLARYEEAGRTCSFIDVSIPDRVLAKPVLD